MKAAKILIVEDEELMRSILRQICTKAGYEVFTADSAESGLRLFSETEIDLTVTDIKMAGRDGIELLGQIRRIDDAAIVIVLTAFSSIDTAISALRNGAYDYVTKPFNNDDLLRRIDNGVRQRRLILENAVLRRQIARQNDTTDLIGNSEAMTDLVRLIDRVSTADSSVLITGETGTGKELVARSIHTKSGRGDRPFVAINCGAIPRDLIESELFGHEKGSFTGAISTEKGLFRSAGNGTVFLDEIAEMPVELQVKLLRVLQEREVTPIGSSRSFRFEARVLAATNRDLRSMVANGTFREDLFFRLNVVEIKVPPLRQRSCDILPLARYFIASAAQRNKMQAAKLSVEAENLLIKYNWPGNIRELENAIERAVLLADDLIMPGHLPDALRVAERSTTIDRSDRSLESVEQQHIEQIMSEVNGDKTAAASILGIDLSTLYRKLKRFGDV